MRIMPSQSQRPIVAKLLTLDPLHMAGRAYISLDDALADMSGDFTPEELADALKDKGISISIDTLYRWKRDGV